MLELCLVSHLFLFRSVIRFRGIGLEQIALEANTCSRNKSPVKTVLLLINKLAKAFLVCSALDQFRDHSQTFVREA